MFVGGKEKPPVATYSSIPRLPVAAHPGCAEHQATPDVPRHPAGAGAATRVLGFLGTRVCTMGKDKLGAFLVSEGVVGSWAPCEGQRRDEPLCLDAG